MKNLIKQKINKSNIEKGLSFFLLFRNHLLFHPATFNHSCVLYVFADINSWWGPTLPPSWAFKNCCGEKRCRTSQTMTFSMMKHRNRLRKWCRRPRLLWRKS